MISWTSGHVVDVDYTFGFYRELTPSLLRVVSLVSGQKAPCIEAPSTYCELGCGQGFSTNLLSAANPHIQFYATDFNPAHIVGAVELAAEAGTKNIHLFEKSFAEFLDEPSLPDFDIISLHGIYSWISDADRLVVVEFIRRKLKPGGLVYVSYNTLPGWASAAPLRHLMYIYGHSRGGGSNSRIEPALEFVDRLQSVRPVYFRLNPLLKSRFERLKANDRRYLAHEYLTENWAPLYHSEVVAQLRDAKLTYVGSAALLEQVDSINLTPEQQQILAEISDLVVRETVRDFIVNQQFRRDVFVKGAVPLSQMQSEAIWLDRRFALSTPRTDVPMTITGSQIEEDLHTEVYAPILDVFGAGPQTVREIIMDRRIAELGWTSLQKALILLVGAGHLQPCLDAKGDSKRMERTRAFNNAVLTRSQSSSELNFLASPVVGGGIEVPRFEQLFLLAREKNVDAPQFVWNVLSKQGKRLVKEGKVLETPDENLAELRSEYDQFFTKQLGVLEQLGIA